MLKKGDAVWVYRALKVAEATDTAVDAGEASRSVEEVKELLLRSGCEAKSQLASAPWREI